MGVWHYYKKLIDYIAAELKIKFTANWGLCAKEVVTYIWPTFSVLFCLCWPPNPKQNTAVAHAYVITRVDQGIYLFSRISIPFLV